jgi:hypothetical protein
MKTLSVAFLALLILGCESRLETGYEPHKLGVSDAQRRGYYAAPYTPEARAATHDQYGDPGMVRPRVGGANP